MRLTDRSLSVPLTIIAIFVLSVATVNFRVSARQQQPQTKCPVIKLTCPSEVSPKDTLKVTVEVRGGDPKVTPTYNWTVSAGSIESGQGTPAILVNTTGLEGGSFVTATVEAGGFDRDCGYGSTAGSCTTSVLKQPEARKLDEYGKLPQKDEDARLDNFLIELNQDPSAQGFILSYNVRASRAGDAQKAADRARDYLVRKRGLEKNRVVTVTGGSREEQLVELWIVPVGARPPKPTSTAELLELGVHFIRLSDLRAPMPDSDNETHTLTPT